MAIGSDARSVGYPTVPDTGEEGRIRWGGREINRTRDFVAQVKKLIPTSRPAWRTTCGITSGTVNPSGGSDGDIYFKII
ncbi:hypothetical protein SEA_ARGAN_28 [Arthrobacter phage Argan]|nr:hypothetical protein SEA_GANTCHERGOBLIN_28 [Arthrobacter phage GantcherGoblin]UVK62851.1 hypothetical protein SEA_UZUMAKI_29 [Arthrobacter phage Uzumaki]WNT45412.1 hypothetical protein SEA_ARGAN_28 [Arthrobacter phage Argan]